MMRAGEFTAALSKAKPRVADLLKVGLTELDAVQMLAGFDIHERPIKRRADIHDEVLADLFDRYDVSAVEIGMVRFGDEPERVAWGWAIGSVETDRLVVDARSGEVIVTESFSQHLLWKAASDGDALLAALAEAARFLGASALAEQASPEREAAVAQCARLAGGDLYKAFYAMLIGGD